MRILCFVLFFFLLRKKFTSYVRNKSICLKININLFREGLKDGSTGPNLNSISLL